MSPVNASRPARERGAKTLDNGLRVLEAIATRPGRIDDCRHRPRGGDSPHGRLSTARHAD